MIHRIPIRKGGGCGVTPRSAGRKPASHWWVGASISKSLSGSNKEGTPNGTLTREIGRLPAGDRRLRSLGQREDCRCGPQALLRDREKKQRPTAEMKSIPIAIWMKTSPNNAVEATGYRRLTADVIRTSDHSPVVKLLTSANSVNRYSYIVFRAGLFHRKLLILNMLYIVRSE